MGPNQGSVVYMTFGGATHLAASPCTCSVRVVELKL